MNVSVVMPTRNAEATLREAAESILRQSHSDLEFVIVDHGSSDGTPGIIRDLVSEDPRVRALTCDATFIDAANLAWRASGGDLVARMDSDDIAHPERIARQVAFMESHPDFAACATRVRIRKRFPDGTVGEADSGYAAYEDWINSVVSPGRIERERFIDSPIPNPTAMIRRTALEETGGYRDREWAEDYDLWLRLLERGARIGKIEAPLLDWFDGESRATRTQRRYLLENFQKAKAHFLARIPLVRRLGVVISGAGPTGRRISRFLEREGATVHGFFEVNPRQIGSTAAGRPVFPVPEMPDWEGKAVMLAAVGQPGARDRIRRLMDPTTFREGTDFFCVA